MRTAFRLLPALLVAAGCSRPAVPIPADPAPGEATHAGPVLRVEAAYPGANAKVVADTIAAPIEEQVHGVEGLVALESESRDDGTYTLTVRFKPGTDVNEATVLIQNGVSIAAPQIPDAVSRQGVTVRRGDPDHFPRFWVAVTSPDRTHDAAFLHNYAALKMKDELLRVPGVADVIAVAAAPSVVRVWLDSDKLTARGANAIDVVVALGNVVGLPEAGLHGTRFTIKAGDKPTDLKAVEDTVVGEKNGAKVFLRDVGKVEVGPGTDAFARVNDHDAALLAVVANPDGPTPDAIRKALPAPEVLPKGVRAELVADVSAGGVAVELRLPDTASRTRTLEAVARAVKLLRTLPNSPECVAWSDRTTNAATILVKRAPKDGPTADGVRKALAGLKDVAVRVSDLSHGRPFPVRVAITDAGGHGQEKLWAAGDALAKRLAADGVALDPAVTPGPATPQLSLRIDREKAAKLGVKLSDVHDTLQAFVGVTALNDFNRFGREFIVAVKTEGNRDADAMKKLQLRGADGKVVPLGTIAEIRDELGELTILRVNRHPAVVVTADVPPGKTLAEVTAACLKAATAEVPRGFKVLGLSSAKPR